VGQKSAELAEEQAYFDRAEKHRERHRRGLSEAPSAAVNPGAAERLRVWVKARWESARPARDAVAFGRTDDEQERTLYIGNELITDDRREVLVVNWQAPAAAPYYEAKPGAPHGLVRKRTYICDGNAITDFVDVLFRQVAEEIVRREKLGEPVKTGEPGEASEPEESERLAGPEALLLSEVDRGRDGAMRSIAATIQATQYELIRAPLDQILVIEGGPGTGKTAVALHRVSWLLFNHRDRLGPADVLVVGPSPAFTRYVRTVLPELGNVEITHVDVGQLAPAVLRGRPEPVPTSRLKGDARMAGLLVRALEARIGTPEPSERMLFAGRFISLIGVQVQSIVDECEVDSGPYATRRELLRARLLDLARARGAPLDAERLEPVENLVERLWPHFSAPAFLRDLLGSRRRLAAAAGEDFTSEELALLQRRGADRLSQQIWSDADLPLLDELDHLINGVGRQYRHIVLDEAQDLSPMQARAIARRSATGSLTVVGDLAQSIGAWARDGWADLLRQLPAAQPRTVATLRYGYRVPRRVYDFAARLLPVAAPGTAPLQVVRDGPAEPRIHRVDAGEQPGCAVAVALDHVAQRQYVGLICPPPHRQEVADALAANQVAWSSAERSDPEAVVHLVSPQEAKGLEFDAVVVVEPEEIVAGDERGHHMLFIALTRTTRYLDIVCAGEALPLALHAQPATEQGAPGLAADAEAQFDARLLDGLAAQIAATVSAGAPVTHWGEALERAAALLDRQRGAATSPATGRHRRD
jgi:DNA helicase IV